MRPAEHVPERIVSLVPCLTETLAGLGGGDRIVGVTRYCPPVPGAAVVGGIWDLDFAAIAALQPDCVLADPRENRDEDLKRLAERYRVLRFGADSVPGSTDVVSRIDRLLRPGSAGLGFFDQPRPGQVIEVVVPIWLEPLRFTGGGTYTSDLLEWSGFANRVTESGFPAIVEEGELGDADRLAGAWVLLPTEPHEFTEEDALRYAQTYPEAAGFRVVDGRDLFWYGIRTPGAIDNLLALHAELSKETP